MTNTAVGRAGGNPASCARSSVSLTEVELTWIEKRIENWIRFGRDVGEEILDRRRRILSYRPDSILAFIRWTANDFGTVFSRIDVLRAVRPGEPFQTLPFVRPGGEILLTCEGWPKVEKVLKHIDAIEAAGLDTCAVSPDHWRHVANRLSVNLEPRAYTPERHRAWIKRRRVEG